MWVVKVMSVLHEQLSHVFLIENYMLYALKNSKSIHVFATQPSTINAVTIMLEVYVVVVVVVMLVYIIIYINTTTATTIY